MNLNQIKQEARERLEAVRKEHGFAYSTEQAQRHTYWDGYNAGLADASESLEETLDRLLDEIEKVLPEYSPDEERYPTSDVDYYRNIVAGEIQEAFTRFKGESVAEGECSCEEPHVSKRVVHVRKGEGNCHVV